jgi:hypothetical protein
MVPARFSEVGGEGMDDGGVESLLHITTSIDFFTFDILFIHFGASPLCMLHSAVQLFVSYKSKHVIYAL